MILGTVISGVAWSGEAPVFGTLKIYVSSTSGMVIGDTIEIMLNNGEFFKTTITRIPHPGQINIAKPLPYFASAGNIVNDLTQTTTIAASGAELSTDLGG